MRLVYAHTKMKISAVGSEVIVHLGLGLDFGCDGLHNLVFRESVLTEETIAIAVGSPFPVIPEGVASVRIDGCQLEELPLLPSTTKKLYCTNNNFKVIDRLPPNLELLDCSVCPFLESISNLPDSLTILNCSGCTNLSSIEKFGPKLERVWARQTSFVRLPPLANIVELAISGTRLLELPPLPDTLQELACYRDDVGGTKDPTILPVKIPRIPRDLKRLYCSSSLDELPRIPLTLTTLVYNKNMPSGGRLAFPWQVARYQLQRDMKKWQQGIAKIRLCILKHAIRVALNA